MISYLARELDDRIKPNKTGGTDLMTKKRSKTVIDLALDTYLDSRENSTLPGSIDQTFKDFAISQVRMFIFGGHDLSGSTICYMFHLLAAHPVIRSLLVAEHNQLFGPDHRQAAAGIAKDPHLLNQLPYTAAIIKETLRLYPPASSTREGDAGYTIPGSQGLSFPTDGLLVWSISQAIHRDPMLWPEPDSFIPSRWLVEEGDPLYPVKGAFRPFEFGPRNCIGQELAMMELKIVLIMTLREFEIRSVYDEWDQLHPTKGPKTVNGDRAYQILAGSAHPNGGLPCRVRLAAS